MLQDKHDINPLILLESKYSLVWDLLKHFMEEKQYLFMGLASKCLDTDTEMN